MNAKKELLEHIKDREVKYVEIAYDNGYGDNPDVYKGLLCDVVDKLDFEYNDGYGGQELFGFIWYSDGTWSDRGEYDGSEWWQYQKCPELPENYLKSNNQ